MQVAVWNGRSLEMLKKIVLVICVIISVEAEVRIYLMDGPIQRIGGRIYKKELLTDQYSSPKELAYDSSSRNLYFMYMDDEIGNSGRAFINVVTKHNAKIKGIELNKATAVDAETGEVYFGSENGLYKLDRVSNEAKNIGLYNMNIMKLVIREFGIYLLDANDHALYKVINEGTTAVKIGNANTIMEFDVDYKRNIHFVSMCGLFCAVNGQEVVKNKDLSLVYNFIIDSDKTFGLTEHGLYEINCYNGTAKKVAELDFFPKSILFGDYGDIFYTEDDGIYRLKPINSYLVYTIRGKHN